MENPALFAALMAQMPHNATIDSNEQLVDCLRNQGISEKVNLEGGLQRNAHAMRQRSLLSVGAESEGGIANYVSTCVTIG